MEIVRQNSSRTLRLKIIWNDQYVKAIQLKHISSQIRIRAKFKCTLCGAAHLRHENCKRKKREIGGRREERKVVGYCQIHEDHFCNIKGIISVIMINGGTKSYNHYKS